MTKTILQLSDIHFTDEPGGLVHGDSPEEGLDRVLAAWRRSGEAADLVLLTGDVAEDFSRGAYERLSGVIAELGVPVAAVPGNHDDPKILAEYFDSPTKLSLGDWHLVFLDTSRPDQIHGEVDVSAAAEALAELNGPVLIVMHHPPVSISTHRWFVLDNADDFMSLLDTNPWVRGVVSGHLHQAFDLESDNRIQLLGCPSTLVGIRHDGAEWTVGERVPIGARVLHLGDDEQLSSQLLAA